jgi:hypothetical protein
MPFSEDELRQALQRKDPGPEFSRRVMARVNQAGRKPSATKPWLFAWLGAFKLAPALVTASIAVALLLGAWIGLRSYQRQRELARIQRIQREAEEQNAERQARLALRIASEKLNHVFQKVNGEPMQDDKIRRQRL